MKPLAEHLPESVLTQILENAFQWFVVVNKDLKIMYINEDYCKFLEISREEAFGKPVYEVIENSRMHEVIATGKAQIASAQFIKGTYMLANRVPLRVDGEVVGAFGSVIFRDLNDWHNLSSNVKIQMEKINFGKPTNEGSPYLLENIIGSSKVIRSIKETIQMIAPSDLPVLIQGESGTGKELFAHSIHQLSDRSDKPFIKLNCAAIPPELLESELFGRAETEGRLHLANDGTLFLDDVGNMPLSVQVKLLRVMQEGLIESIGSVQSKKVNVRVIAASNQPLKSLIESGKFREDLYYRIQAITLQLPPLRERMDDFIEITNYLFHKSLMRAGKRNLIFATDTMEYLQAYHWPGNVRELQNVVQAAVYLTNGEVIEPSALPQQIKMERTFYTIGSRTLSESLEEVERNILHETLLHHPDKRAAANILGLSRSTLYEKIKKYDL
ncbi:sigma-54 interaction domain-containing protein [Sporosarcina sp. FA9]|uniref:sigma-54 interaction domain-containing protein n=1 Tax=Sporosarcina sp. FA9 TaxID=3413030 RepID=UPI003F65F282